MPLVSSIGHDAPTTTKTSRRTRTWVVLGVAAAACVGVLGAQLALSTASSADTTAAVRYPAPASILPNRTAVLTTLQDAQHAISSAATVIDTTPLQVALDTQTQRLTGFDQRQDALRVNSDSRWVHAAFHLADVRSIFDQAQAAQAAGEQIQAALGAARSALSAAEGAGVDAGAVTRALPHFAAALPTPAEATAFDLNALSQAVDELNAAVSRAQSSGTSTGGGSAARVSGGGGGFTVNIVCSGIAQSVMDSCSPSGWVQEVSSPFPIVGRHVDFGGAVVFDMGMGDTVTVSGMGTFTVIGSGDLSRDNRSIGAVVSMAPSGTALALQSCNWGGGPIHFVFLAPR